MYGGTCINIGCIPTKTLLVAAEKDLPFEEVIATKNTITGRLNGKNYATVAGTGVDIFDAEAHFLSNKVIEIQAGDEKKELTAETIVINTGAVSNVLPIPGLATSKTSLTQQVSKTWTNCLKNLESLVVEISVLNLLAFTTNLEARSQS